MRTPGRNVLRELRQEVERRENLLVALWAVSQAVSRRLGEALARALLRLVNHLAGVGHLHQPRQTEGAPGHVLDHTLDARLIARRQPHRLIDAKTAVFPGPHVLDDYVRPVREHLYAGLDYQNKMARFLENHDEPRAAATFSPEVHEAASVITFLSPGLRFFRQGELEGRTKRISPHLGRGPNEPINDRIEKFYQRVLTVLPQNSVRIDRWQLLECAPAWKDNWTNDCFLAFTWEDDGGDRLLTIVNYAPNQSQCYVRLPFNELQETRWQLVDLLGDAEYIRDGNDLQERGLYRDATPLQRSVFFLSSDL